MRLSVEQRGDLIARPGCVVGHVAGDRLLGYGLKHTTGFKDTHLERA